MTPALEHVRGALVPFRSLGALADLRREPTISVTFEGDHAWVRWEGPAEPAVRRLLPEPGVVLFESRGGLWYRLGDRLPAFGLPLAGDDRAVPLSRAVLPRAVEPIVSGDVVPAAARLALVRADHPHAATALRCAADDLGRWAEMAPSARFFGLSAARSGHEVMVRGRVLPIVPGERFWGERVLTPLGSRSDPDLTEAALRRVLGVEDDELLVLSVDGFQTIPRAAFRPLSRASVRLVREEGSE